MWNRFTQKTIVKKETFTNDVRWSKSHLEIYYLLIGRQDLISFRKKERCKSTLFCAIIISWTFSFILLQSSFKIKTFQFLSTVEFNTCQYRHLSLAWLRPISWRDMIWRIIRYFTMDFWSWCTKWFFTHYINLLNVTPKITKFKTKCVRICFVCLQRTKMWPAWF